MAARYTYTHATGSNVDVSNRVRAYRTQLKSNAEEGSVAMSQLIVDDPDGGLNILGLRGVTITETSEASNSQITYAGYIADRDVGRGPAPWVGSSREWRLNLVDLNEVINRRIMLGSDAKRPAETDVARVQWLMTTSEFSPVIDSTLISTANPVAMDAVDYRNQRCQDILNDCAQASGKNFFLWLNQNFSPAKYGLFYDASSSSAYPSTLRLSNVLSDVDSVTTFAVSEPDTKLNRDPSRVYSGVVLPYTGGQVYVQDSAIAAEFHARDTLAPSVNVKTAAKASARAQRYIAEAATENDLISTSFLVPLDKVNRVMQGMTLQCKFSHLPGYEDFSYMRALNRTVTMTSEEYYTVGLDLSPAASVSSPHFLIAFAANGFANQPTDNSTHPWTSAWWSGDICATSVIACGAGPPENQGMGMYYRAIVPGESATVATMKLNANSTGGMWVYEIAGCQMSGLSVIHSNVFLADTGTVSVSASASSPSVLFGGFGFGKVPYDGGWCSGWPTGPLLVNSAGTELVSKSSFNDCSAGPSPWCYIAHATGTGTLSIGATANSHGAGAGAYSCGYNVGKGGLLIPAPGGFSIVQSAFGGGGTGATYTVTLPHPPTP